MTPDIVCVMFLLLKVFSLPFWDSFIDVFLSLTITMSSLFSSTMSLPQFGNAIESAYNLLDMGMFAGGRWYRVHDSSFHQHDPYDEELARRLINNDVWHRESICYGCEKFLKGRRKKILVKNLEQGLDHRYEDRN
ncbi:hypothetical protein ARMGADRAFT_1029258 [Armillaria gallica]|uniref:Uncharacterized protein n=1 Tax=Armillaria gallica TaxID=47427 RepID=A0A2H3DI65_ARMGA|nr:hypothetical protein ARMGADRAFT_1029258 [Armillaria gallica]